MGYNIVNKKTFSCILAFEQKESIREGWNIRKRKLRLSVPFRTRRLR